MNPTRKSTQIALFYQTIYNGAIEGISTSLRNRFGIEVQITEYPIPREAPPVIPRMEATLGNILLRLSYDRADMICTDQNEPTAAQILNFIQTILDLGVTVGRIGYVCTKNIEGADQVFVNRNLRLSNETATEITRLTEAQWRVNRVFEILGAGGNCNNISNIILEKINGQQNVILERDINTTLDRNLNLRDLEQIQNVVSSLRTESDSTFGIL